MRSRPRIWRGGSKAPRRSVPHRPPQCREVLVEVMGVSPGLQRIDIVADDHQPSHPIHQPEPKDHEPE